MTKETMEKIIGEARAATLSPQAERECIALLSILGSCLKRNSRKRYVTNHGEKTELGLYLLLKDFFKT